MRQMFFAAAIAAMAAAGPLVAQYDLPISRPAVAAEPPDPKPVYKYELKPEHGAWLVCVKTFKDPSRPIGWARMTAAEKAQAIATSDTRCRELAEGFVEHIRGEGRLNAFVFERGWSVRQQQKKELKEVFEAKRKYYESKGIPPTPELMRVKIVDYLPNDYSVLIAPARGTLKDLDGALEFAKRVRLIPAPPAEFCDSLFITQGTVVKEKDSLVNPFETAFPGPNPAIARANALAAQRPKAEAYLLTFNSEESYSLIHKTKKPWTLLVQVYGGVGSVTPAGGTAQSSKGEPGELLERGAKQAHAIAELLRKTKPAFDAYVLHTKYNSLLCIGEFDSADDLQLKATAKNLGEHPLLDKKTGRVIEDFLEHPYPVLIPRP